MTDMKAPDQRITSLVNTGVIGAFASDGATAVNVVVQNIAGFAPEALRQPIERIINEFRSGNKNVAKAQLSVLRDVPSQDPRTVPALDIVATYLDLFDEDETEIAAEILRKFAKENGCQGLFGDLCTSALIRLEYKSGDLESAQNIWSGLENPGEYTSEAYYSRIAQIDVLENTLNTSRGLTTVPELRGLVDGLLRVEKYDLAKEAVDKLKAINSEIYTDFLKLLVDSCLIQQRIGSRHVWSIESSIYDELQNISEVAARILSENPSLDQRLPLSAARILFYLNGESPELSKACWENIDRIEKCHPECAGVLRHQNTHDVTCLDAHFQDVIKANGDPSFKRQHLDDLLNKRSITVGESIFLHNHASSLELKKWIASGGSCVEEDPFSKELLEFSLFCGSVENSNDLEAVREVQRQWKNITSSHKDNLPKMHPPFALILAEMLVNIGLANEAAQLIESLLSTRDYWLSPLFVFYLNALLNGEKMLTLENALDSIPEKNWDYRVWRIRARTEYAKGEANKARESLNKSLSLQPTIQSAAALVDLLRNSDRVGEIEETLSKIPDEVFDSKDHYSWFLINEMFKLNLHERAESLVLEWFVKDPEGNAVAVTDLFNWSIIGNTEIKCTSMPKLDPEMIGVRYNDGKTSLTKIIISPDYARGQYFLSSNSPLGRKLKTAELNVSFVEGIGEYKLEEKLPALVAAYRISSEIRDTANQGDDPFHVLQLPNDPTELIEQLSKVMKGGNERKGFILDNEQLPIMFKGEMLKSDCPLTAAIGVLGDAEAKKQPLPDFASDELYDELLLDVYSFAYLAMTGLFAGIIESGIKVYISKETDDCINKWLTARQRDNGGVMGTHPDGKPFLLTQEEIRQRTEYIAEKIKTLRLISDVLPTASCDMPPELISIRGSIDISVYSTARLAIANKIPWLCIDFPMAKLIDGMGGKVVKNCLHVLIKTNEKTQFFDKRNGIYHHVFSQLPVPITVPDMLSLARDKDVLSVVALTKLVQLNPNTYQNLNGAVTVLREYLVAALAASWDRGEIRLANSVTDACFPSHIAKLFNVCLYIISIQKSENETEYNVALFLHYIKSRIIVTNIDTNISDKLIRVAFELGSFFIFGHFLMLEKVVTHMESFCEELS